MLAGQPLAITTKTDVHVCKAAVPNLREQGCGHIFQIASIGARIASAGLSAYDLPPRDMGESW